MVSHAVHVCAVDIMSILVCQPDSSIHVYNREAAIRECNDGGSVKKTPRKRQTMGINKWFKECKKAKVSCGGLARSMEWLSSRRWSYK